MSSAERISASCTVKATPSAVFAIVADPRKHVEIDGSGMLEAAPGTVPLTAVGDTFEIDMDREPLGDIPSMGKYRVLNTVTRIVPNELVEWDVRSVERDRSVGHVYGWEITPAGNGETTVTNYCDWSQVPEEHHGRFPVVPLSMMEKSVANLAAMLA